MKHIFRNIAAVVLGLFLGGAANMALIMVSGYIIPPPDGADVTTMEGLQASMHLFTPINFLFPFLAHAFGTLAGAYIAAKIAGSKKRMFALIIGGFYLIGGIANILMLPSPMWYSILDISVCYIPMAWLGWKLAGGKK